MEAEQTKSQPERALEGGVQLDIEKRMLVENYLQNIQETHSMTTETSDSGIRTHGATSEIEMQDISGNYFILVMACQSPKCLADGRVKFQQDRKTLSYSTSTCNLQRNFSVVRDRKNFRSLGKISSLQEN